MLGGMREREQEIEESKQNLYYIMVNLLLSSLLALIYTNDLFTAYVFVEINTISACGLIMIRQNGRTIVAATRYMIMSLLGSGMLLLGICFLYGITGQLLMSNIQESVSKIHLSGVYDTPLIVRPWTDVGRAGGQECLVSVSWLAAGCIWIFYGILSSDSFFLLYRRAIFFCC